MSGDADALGAGACCPGPLACAFTKAVLSREADCRLARRHAAGERELVGCASPVARVNCETLAALLRERAGFALRLPRPSAPLMHIQALRLQCGGVRALQQVLQAERSDIHQLVGLAQDRWGSLIDAPWAEIVPAVAAWQPRRRRRPSS